MNPGWRVWSAIAGLLGLCAGLQFAGLGPVLRWSRDAIAAGQFWRIVTGNLVHIGFTHFLMNAVGTVLVAALVGSHLRATGWAAAWLVCALAVGLGLWWGQPELGWYVGLSGVLHGLVVTGAIAALGDYRERLFAVVVLLAIGGKVAFEHWAGAMPGSAALAGGHVITAAHLYGAVGGVIAGTATLVNRRVLLRIGASETE